MPNCREVARILTAGDVEGARWSRRVDVRFHLLMCRHCRGYAAQLRIINREARELLHKADLLIL